MKRESTPEPGARYWLSISAASVAGCNLGDFISLYLHLGHWLGLAPLALLLAAVLIGERRSGASELWYWGAIILVRTAATNVADLATHTFNIDYLSVIAALSALQVLAVLKLSARANEPQRERYPRPLADGWYWTSMMIAGTLGTAVGDCVAETMKLGTGWGAIALSAILAATLMLGFRTRWSMKGIYWLAILAVRSAGTTAGDWLAFPEGGGLGLGLLLSTCLSCAIFIATVVCRHARRPHPNTRGYG